MSKILVMIATYNERNNVAKLCAEIAALSNGLDLLFVDDNSPDGTGELLDELKNEHKNLHILHRPGKSGIGNAHQAGIRWAYDHGYTSLVTMDGDFTHPPQYIADFLAAGAEGSDVIVGSRYMRSDSLKEWNFFRWLLTHAGHLMTTHFLDLPYDATGAFRFYRLDRIPRELFDLIQSNGYSFFYESLFALKLNRFAIAEVPITLPARTYGSSKMRLGDAWGSVMFLIYLYLTEKLEPERMRLAAKVVIEGDVVDDPAAKEWDKYWLNRKPISGMAYDIIAAIYRKFIIRPQLNRVIRRQFKIDSELLHAGCGSGQVDSDIADEMKITALDISRSALRRYGMNNCVRGKLLLGSVFAIPLPDKSMRGVYNLGVMEHFTQDQIHTALSEFRRVLTAEGKIVLFWPPEYGLSVTFLKVVHYVMQKLFKQSHKLHPDEISRLRSRNQAAQVLDRAGLRLIDFYFGPRDLFTYAVVVGSPAQS